MKTITFLLIFFLFFFVPVYAQQAIPAFRAEPLLLHDADLKKKFSSFQLFHLPTAEIEAYTKGKDTCRLHLDLGGDLNLTLALARNNLAAPDHKILLQTSEGNKTLYSSPDYLFKGYVLGTGDAVRLAIKEGFLYGFITNSGVEYFIEPLKKFYSEAEKDEFIVYPATSVKDFQLSCGYNRDENAFRQPREQRVLDSSAGQDIGCRKLKFGTLIDYSVFRKFSSIGEVEAFVLGNLNVAESAFQTLNLKNTGTDISTDRLSFEQESITISVCSTCDFISPSNNANDLASELSLWTAKNHINTGSKIYQFYTARDMFTPLGQNIIGYSHGSYGDCSVNSQYLRYTTNDAASLRVLVAHETGHNLSCDHDNAKRPGVNNFIMYSAAGPSHTTFSTLADFGGTNYSSHLAMNDFLKRPSINDCLGACDANTCEKINGLKTERASDGSVQLSWNGLGQALIKYKIRDSAFFPSENILSVTGNTARLTNLQPCGIYAVQFQSVCSPGVLSQATTIELAASSPVFSVKPVSIRDRWYDLEVNYTCTDCPAKEYTLQIDSTVFSIPIKKGHNKFNLPNFFADGARHRVQFRSDSAKNSCNTQAFYLAPYYRANSRQLLSADFNDCKVPSGWKDSVINNVVQGTANPYWISSSQNAYNRFAVSGTIDSSCMIYYNNLQNWYRGSLALKSPKINLSAYQNVMLHFDYNIAAYRFPNTARFGSLMVQVFDGSRWETVWRVVDSTWLPRGNVSIDIWKLPPSRIFIPLDHYKNANFEVRFIVDDGSMAGPTSTLMFAALDNIVLDAYPEAQNQLSEPVIFPNPSTGDLFIRLDFPLTGKLLYQATDALGRIVSKGELRQNKVSVRHLAAGLYIFQVFLGERCLVTKRIVKY